MLVVSLRGVKFGFWSLLLMSFAILDLNMKKWNEIVLGLDQ